MNYLIQAYACSTNQGGEYAVSWGWISCLDQVVDENDHIYVVSLTLTEQEIIAAGLKHTQLVPVKGMDKFNFLNYNSIYYYIWQKKAYRAVVDLKKNIDVLHIYSLSDFRKIGKWHKIKNVYKILGPVGGGQTCPRSLEVYDDKRSVITRNIINMICKYNPFYKFKTAKYSKIYACNRETQQFLKGSDLLVDVPLNDRFKNLEITKKISAIPTILFVGRLINKKGLLFLLDVLDYIDDNIPYKVVIYGDGDQKQLIKDKIIKKGLQTSVSMLGKIPYKDISSIYKDDYIFVLPSLRESGGSVLIEAMAHKLPIVALNMSLSTLLDERKCGLFVNINQSRENILKEFADSLVKLIKNPELRDFYGNNGYNFVNSELTWNNMIKEVYGKFLDSNSAKL